MKYLQCGRVRMWHRCEWHCVCAAERKNVILNVSRKSASQLLWHDISFSPCTSCWHFDDTLFCKPQIWHIKCLSSISFSLGVLHLFIQLLCVPGICQRERLWPIRSPEAGWVHWPLSWLKDCEQASPPGKEVLFLCIWNLYQTKTSSKSLSDKDFMQVWASLHTTG